MKPLELYIHIPFCIQKCLYCDFRSAPSTKEERQEYVLELCRQIRTYRKTAGDYHIVSIFVGGGTPSILEGEQIRGIFGAIRETFVVDEDAEITIEMNPGTVTEEKLKVYREAGIDRLSIGLQSAENEELKILGRIHTYEEFLDTYRLAREMGFGNVSVDLMSAIPGQTAAGWEKTLRKVAGLRPEHISAYSLIIEEGTPFYEKYGKARDDADALRDDPLPDEEEERQMYRSTKKILGEYGYQQYEISNYALPGYECRHNLGYWERTEYRGYGLGAASLLGQVRYTNQTELTEYLKGNTRGTSEPLTEQAVREEYFFLGLRKTDGVPLGAYGAHYEELIKKLTAQQLLEERDGRIRLTDRGIDVSNYVLAQFLD